MTTDNHLKYYSNHPNEELYINLDAIVMVLYFINNVIAFLYLYFIFFLVSPHPRVED